MKWQRMGCLPGVFSRFRVFLGTLLGKVMTHRFMSRHWCVLETPPVGNFKSPSPLRSYWKHLDIVEITCNGSALAIDLGGPNTRFNHGIYMEAKGDPKATPEHSTISRVLEN